MAGRKILTKLEPKKTLFLFCDIQDVFRQTMKLFDPMVVNVNKLVSSMTICFNWLNFIENVGIIKCFQTIFIKNHLLCKEIIILYSCNKDYCKDNLRDSDLIY